MTDKRLPKSDPPFWPTWKAITMKKTVRAIEAIDLQGVDVLEDGVVPSYAATECDDDPCPDCPDSPTLPGDTLPG